MTTQRQTCPHCGAPVLHVRTPDGEELMLDIYPCTDIYTLNTNTPDMAVQMPSSVTRREHRCEKAQSTD